jgi:hypothetical protein
MQCLQLAEKFVRKISNIELFKAQKIPLSSPVKTTKGFQNNK